MRIAVVQQLRPVCQPHGMSLTSGCMQLMLLSRAAIQEALQSRPKKWQEVKRKAEALYQEHLRQCITAQRPPVDYKNDTSVAKLSASMSFSRDIHIEGLHPEGTSAAGEGPPVGSGHRDGQGSVLQSGDCSSSSFPAVPARPSHDRPTTFD